MFMYNNLPFALSVTFLYAVLKSRYLTPVFPLTFSLGVREFPVHVNSQERNSRERQGIPVNRMYDSRYLLRSYLEFKIL